jgi:hypothetical protein
MQMTIEQLAAIMKIAEQENRRRDREIKRATKNEGYAKNGLNGPRAVARRLRKMAS